MRQFLALALGLAIGGLATPTESDSSQKVIWRDVAIIGGGSAGTYAAVQLKDKGKSVVVIEKEAVLGGHANTYVDKDTGIHVNVGVVDFHNIPVVTEYFARLKVAASNPGAYNYSTKYYDFDTGLSVPNFVPPSDAEIGAAVEKYIAILTAKYQYLQAGWFLPDPVPEELLASFGQFANQNGLQNAMQIFNQVLQNDGNIWEVPAAQAIKGCDITLAQAILAGFLTITSGDTRDIYTSAAKVLEGDVLYSSQAVHVDRSQKNGVTLVVQTPHGTKIVKAKRLVVAIPPLPSMLRAVDLTSSELSVFSKFQARGYYAGIIESPAINDSEFFTNVGAHTPYYLQHLPGMFTIEPLAGLPGKHGLYYGTLDASVSTQQAQQMILKQIGTMQSTGAFGPGKTDFLYFVNHDPFRLYVSADQIKNGFYRDLYALQGHRDTFWTGAAWITQDSSLIWNYTQTQVLPALLQSLQG